MKWTVCPKVIPTLHAFDSHNGKLNLQPQNIKTVSEALSIKYGINNNVPQTTKLGRVEE